MTTPQYSHFLFPEIQKAWDSATPFQIEDAHFVARHGRVVVGHKTGQGKTYIPMLAWSLWPNARKGLIVGTLSSMATWKRILGRWGGAEVKFIRGYDDPEWQVALNAEEGIWACTYMTLLGLMKKTNGKPYFDVLINDELHRVMRKKNSITKMMWRIGSTYYVGCSATWASRGPQDCWPVLHLINKKLFSSYWRFVETWCYVENTKWGKEIFGVRNLENLKRMLYDRFYVTRPFEASKQFNPNAPDKPTVRRTEILPMDPEQLRMYTQLDTEMIAELGDQMLVVPNSLARLTKLLQLSIAPGGLMPTLGEGAAIRWLCDKVSEDPHTVVFSPFKMALEELHSALVKDGYPEDKIFYLHGGLDPDEVNEITDKWKAAKGLMKCTIDFAQSFSLDTTHTAYMLGFDWDPNDNIQAEGRLRRLDSELTDPCIVTYIIPEGSAYDDVKEVVNGKYITTTQFLSGRIPSKLAQPTNDQIDTLDNSQIVPL